MAAGAEENAYKWLESYTASKQIDQRDWWTKPSNKERTTAESRSTGNYGILAISFLGGFDLFGFSFEICQTYAFWVFRAFT